MNNIKIIDTHSHVGIRSFGDELNQVINKLEKENVYSYNIGTCIQDSKEIIELSKKSKNLIPVIGVHPCDTENWNNSFLKELEFLLKNNKNIAAIGEIGLDYFHKPYNPDEQKIAFNDQINLANKYNLPVVVHTRESLEDCFEIVKKYKNTKFLFHSWSGDIEITKKFLQISNNVYFSYNGILTFKNAKVQKEVIKIIPLDKLMFETDCPWLSPEPFRGQKNFPWRVTETIKYAANLLNIEFSELNKINNENANNFYKINHIL